MRSSYIQNNYGDIFRNLVLAFKPGKIVELGVLDGYSTIHLAMGVKERIVMNLGGSHVDAYDLWDKYPYNHGNKDTVQKLLDVSELSEYVTLYEMDAWDVHKNYENNSIDMLHIDISNDGDIFEKMFDLWFPKLRFQSVFLFEGGTEERDNIDWMIKYNRKPIRKTLEAHPVLNKVCIWGTYEAFPGLTTIIKKCE